MQWIFNEAGGRKMLLAILGIISMTVLACMKVIDGTTAVDTIKWIILGVAGALAVSDIGNGLAARKPDPVTPPVEEKPPVTGGQ